MNAMLIGYLLISSVYIFTTVWGHISSERRIREAYIEGSNEAQNMACGYVEGILKREGALKEKYSELLMAVARKFPDESRHQTALRYIREAEVVDTNQFNEGSLKEC